MIRDMGLLVIGCLYCGSCYEDQTRWPCHLYGDFHESSTWYKLHMPGRQEKPSPFEQESTILPIDPPGNAARGANESVVGNPRCSRRVR